MVFKVDSYSFRNYICKISFLSICVIKILKVIIGCIMLILFDRHYSKRVYTIKSLLIVSEPLSSFVKMSGTDSAGRFNILSQMEHLQSKYMGTGHADTTKFEWATHQHR